MENFLNIGETGSSWSKNFKLGRKKVSTTPTGPFEPKSEHSDEDSTWAEKVQVWYI
jgi:hypothetical protein